MEATQAESVASAHRNERYVPTPTPAPPAGFRVVTEGQAHVLFPEAEMFFYNNAQVFNRDLSVMVAKLVLQKKHAADVEKAAAKAARYAALAAEGKAAAARAPLPARPLRVLDALSASGLRAVRYAKEIPGLGSVVANDYDADAVDAIKRNLVFNQLDPSLVTAVHGDAALCCMLNRAVPDRFDLVDLDPFGSAAPFLDSAVQSVSDGGLLAVTCTDMAVLCGNHAEVCFSKYAGTSLRTKFCHELALRIVVGSIASHAARYKRTIEPIFCVSIDFYIRVFVRVRTSAADVKLLGSRLGYVYHCVGCESWKVQPLGKISQRAGSGVKYLAASGPPCAQNCEHCNSRYHLGGPAWLPSLHNAEFVQELKAHVTSVGPELYFSQPKLLSLISAVEEELHDVPFFFSLHGIAKTLRAQAPNMVEMRSAVINAGYRVSQSHTNPLAVKTDAPSEVVWDIMRCSVRDRRPVKMAPQDTVQAAILGKAPTLEANFTRCAGAATSSVPRFLPNPEENWGPGSLPCKSSKKQKKTA